MVIGITKEYLEGVVRWTELIRQYKKDLAKYYILKKLQDEYNEPEKPKKMIISKVALRKTQEFINYHIINKTIPKDCIELANKIMEEEF